MFYRHWKYARHFLKVTLDFARQEMLKIAKNEFMYEVKFCISYVSIIFFETNAKKGFFSAFDLKQYILTHSDVKRCTCPACGKQLKNDSCYRRHMVCVHGQKYSCELCSKDYSALMGLNIHKRDVHGIIT